ncbi:MAG TPA: T9SS type A sorting domain-containing protein [Flavobacteriaceae bacterium]|nr:T9SS type A sorting domain-containing protein [Flavobacteriaceae bacterium]
MKKIFILLFVITSANTFSQIDCTYDEETYRYNAVLEIETIPIDFDKNDFINFITSLDNISNEDLETLNTHITSVFKTIPSSPNSKNITIVSTAEIYTILDNLNNSIDVVFCVITDCELSDGGFQYYALMRNGTIPEDYNKEDFINDIIEYDDISNEDLEILNTHITSVIKAFPTAQTEVLQRVVIVDSTEDIFFILANLPNAIEHHTCVEDEIIISTENHNPSFLSIYPNPVTNVLTLKSIERIKEVWVYDIYGSGLNFYDSTEINVTNLQAGMYFLLVKSENGSTITKKFIKN